MLSALLAASLLTLASRVGWPVSTTHSIVGAIVGFALVAIGFEAIYWSKISQIAASWIVSPMLSGFVGFCLILSVRYLILDTADPKNRAKKIVPFYVFLTTLVIALVTFLKGLKHVGLELDSLSAILYSVALGLVIAVGSAFVIRAGVKSEGSSLSEVDEVGEVEKIFIVLMIVTASAMAFAHGSNDVANAIGPVAAIISIVETGEITQSSPVPIYVLLVGGVGIVVGLATFGARVIATVGSRITELTPSRGFAATLAAAATVVLASYTGLPISTTHTLVGAVLGVGLARGVEALDLSVVRNIFVSWIVTLPAGGILAAVFYLMLRGIFG